MANSRRRRLISREEYLRSLLPGATDEETRQTILAMIEGEKGRPRDGAVLEEGEDQKP